MKRMLTLTLAFLLAASLSSCGGNREAPTEPGLDTVTEGLAPGEAAEFEAREENAPQGNGTEAPEDSASPEQPSGTDDPSAAELPPGAEEAARAYYAGTVFEVISMEPRARGADEVTFSVRASKGGIVQEPDRSITVSLVDGSWQVTGEGY